MRPYQALHRAYCGVDLHARTMFLRILDHGGRTPLHEDIPATKAAFLEAIAPHREGLAVAREGVFARYWLADACDEAGIPFVPGHAPEMRAIHGAKAKNDRGDSEKIAHLLRTGLLPRAYAYPAAMRAAMRAARDLLRRRAYPVRRRAGAPAHVRIIHGRCTVAAATGKLRYAANRAGVLDHFGDEAVRRTLGVDPALVEHLDGRIAEPEAYSAAQAEVHDLPSSYRLRSIPGVGKAPALTTLYEVGDIRRFDDAGPFLSYARLVHPAKESAGERVGLSSREMGNAHPKRAFREAATLMTRRMPEAKAFAARKAKAHGKGEARAILAAELGRAVCVGLRRGIPFDEGAFMRR